MGYSTRSMVYPPENLISDHLQSLETTVFFEIAHGSYMQFAPLCASWGIFIYTTTFDLRRWLEDYPNIPFSFLASCNGLCATGPSTLSYELRKGGEIDKKSTCFLSRQ